MAENGQILGSRRRSGQTKECLRALGVRVDGPGGWSESPARWFELTTEDRERLLSASLWVSATYWSADRAVRVRSIHRVGGTSPSTKEVLRSCFDSPIRSTGRTRQL